MPSKKYERPHLARCIMLAGSLPAGIIMYRLMAWKPMVQRDGRKWIVKSRQELMFETSLSPKQVRDGLTELRRKGFIETSKHMFQGRTVTHFMVTAEFEKFFLEVALPREEVPSEEVLG